MRRPVFCVALGLLVAACGASPLVREAERGDFARLKADVAAREKLGTLGNAEAACVARGVAAWAITAGPKDEQLARVREVRACARELDGALADRMKTRDAAGAEAALARVESGAMSAGEAREHAGDVEDAWRAVGARGLVREDDDAARVQAYLDPAPAVRRAAMHAAIVAHDARDVDALAEAARVDPEPIVRTDAVRALAAIGGAAVVSKLRDLWTNADEPLREDIAVAYARPASWSAGGRDELRILVASGHGPGVVEAAGAVLRRVERDAADQEVYTSASALLARTIDKGSARDRLHAIAVSPKPAGPVLESLRGAAKDIDVTVKVAALARLVDAGVDRASNVAALEAVAADDGTSEASPRRGPHQGDRSFAASRAKSALAAAGDLRIQAWIEADLVADAPSARLAAATSLSALGRAGRAAPLLADSDPSVRTRAACALVLADRSGH